MQKHFLLPCIVLGQICRNWETLKLNDRIPDKWLSHIRFMGEALLTGVNDWERRKTEERLENGKTTIEKQFLCCCVGKRLMQKRTYPAGQIDAVKHLQLSGVRVACASSYYHIHHCNMGWYHNILKVSSEASKAFNIVLSISHMLMAILIPG